MQALQIRHVSPAPTVVGYQHKDLVDDGFGVFVATFTDVGKDTLDIQTLIPVSEEAEGEIGLDSFDIQTILPTGGMDEQFLYMTVKEDEVAVDGWYKMGDKSKLADKQFTLGEGLWFYSYWSDSKMRFAGQVEMGDIDIPLAEDGFGVVGIARPAPIGIQNIIPMSEEAEGEIGLDSFDIQTILPTGGMDEQFLYMTVKEDEVTVDGWYKMGDKSKLADNVFQPGEGLWYYSYWSDAFFRLKGLNTPAE